MKKIIILSATLLSVFLVAYSWAVPIATLEVTVNGTNTFYATDNDGIIKIQEENVDNFLDIDIKGYSDPILNNSELDLFSGTLSGGAGTIDIKFTVSGFDQYSFPGYWLNVGGSLADYGSANFQAYWEDESGTHIDIASLYFSDPNRDGIDFAFSGSDGNGTPLTLPYSLTILASIVHNIDDEKVKQLTTFDAKIDPVPEPATIILFGAGLIGLAAYGRARKRKK